MKTTIELPLLPLRDVVVYPHMVIPLFVGRAKSIAALEQAMQGEKQVFLVAQRNPSEDDPQLEQIYDIGCVANVLQFLKLPDGTVKVLVEGSYRAALESIEDIAEPETEYSLATVQLLDEAEPVAIEDDVLRRTLLEQFEQYAQNSKKVPGEVLSGIQDISETSQLADNIAMHLNLRLEQKQEALATLDLTRRVELLLGLLDAELELVQIEKRIRARVKKQMERSQREYYLNEQMKAIQKELGEGEDGQNEIDELRKRIDESGMSEEALKKANAELKKLQQMSPMSAEATVVRSYIEWLVNVPWKAKSRVRHDLERAEQILDAEH